MLNSALWVSEAFVLDQTIKTVLILLNFQMCTYIFKLVLLQLLLLFVLVHFVFYAKKHQYSDNEVHNLLTGAAQRMWALHKLRKLMAANFGDTINVNALLSSPSVDASEQEDTTRPFSMVSLF